MSEKLFTNLKVGDTLYYLNTNEVKDVPFDIPAYDIPYTYNIVEGVVTEVEHITKEIVDFSKPWENIEPVERDCNRLKITIEDLETKQQYVLSIDLTPNMMIKSYSNWFIDKEMILDDIRITYERKKTYWESKLESAKFFLNLYTEKLNTL